MMIGRLGNALTQLGIIYKKNTKIQLFFGLSKT